MVSNPWPVKYCVKQQTWIKWGLLVDGQVVLQNHILEASTTIVSIASGKIKAGSLGGPYTGAIWDLPKEMTQFRAFGGAHRRLTSATEGHDSLSGGTIGRVLIPWRTLDCWSNTVCQVHLQIYKHRLQITNASSRTPKYPQAYIILGFCCWIPAYAFSIAEQIALRKTFLSVRFFSWYLLLGGGGWRG